MVSHVTRLIFVAWLTVLSALIGRGAFHGWSGGIWIALYGLVLGHPTLMAVEFVLSRQVRRRAGLPLRSAGATVRAWLGEWAASTVVFGWRLPWRAQAFQDHLPPGSRGSRGVVFVHGILCNRGIWNPWLARLRQTDRAFIAVDLEPVFGSIDDYVPILDSAVQRMESVTGLPPVIVAHSMGGLVTRAWLRARLLARCGETGGGAALHVDLAEPRDAAGVITIGTPHRGTWMARLSGSAAARQMRVGSDWLRGLEADEPAARAPLFSCWWSDLDQIVFPEPCAVIAGGLSCRTTGSGHVALTAHDEIWADLLRLMQSR